MAELTDAEMIRRLADGEDRWVIDPEHGCTNPLTGYYPATEVQAEKQRREAARPSGAVPTRIEHDGGALNDLTCTFCDSNTGPPNHMPTGPVCGAPGVWILLWRDGRWSVACDKHTGPFELPIGHDYGSTLLRIDKLP